jgi:hypothetical protein
VPARPETPQVTEALVEGRILGRALTRGHYEDPLAAEAEVVASRRSGAEEPRNVGDVDAEEFDDSDDR